MRQLQGNTTKDADQIFELSEMLKRDFPFEKIADWLAVHGIRYSNQRVAHTLKVAGKEDWIELFLKQEDINVGDTVRSKNTGRFGKVIEVKKNGFTVIVKLDAGGKQHFDKGTLIKMREGAVDKPADVTQIRSEYDNYGDIKR